MGKMTSIVIIMITVHISTSKCHAIFSDAWAPQVDRSSENESCPKLLTENTE